MGDLENSRQVTNLDEIEGEIEKQLEIVTDYAIDVNEGSEYMAQPNYRIDERTKRICVLIPACWNKNTLPHLIERIKKGLANLDSLENINKEYSRLQELNEKRRELNGK